MNLNRLLLFLSSFKGIGKTSIRRMIDEHCFENISFEKINDLLEWLKQHSEYFKNKNYIKSLTLEDVSAANDKRIELENKLKAVGANYISWFDEKYPNRFRIMQKTKDYPILLFYKGDIELMNHPKLVSIIGTREPCAETHRIGELIGKYAVEKGYAVVSGLAVGCDTIGHVSCLNAGGKTIAIMGTGIDKVYPKENKELAQRIVDNGGLIITEELPGFSGASYSFVSRDRLQAAGADIVIALETSKNGGTMHASRATMTYRRKLVVVDPLLIQNGKPDGNAYLIRELGADVFKTADDLERIFSVPTKNTPAIERLFIHKEGLLVDKLLRIQLENVYEYRTNGWHRCYIEYDEIISDKNYEEVSISDLNKYMKEVKW